MLNDEAHTPVAVNAKSKLIQAMSMDTNTANISLDEIRQSIVRVIKDFDGSIPISYLMTEVEGFQDSSWMAMGGYKCQTLRIAEPKGNVIAWEGHSVIGGEALISLISIGVVTIERCDKRLYGKDKLSYPVIESGTDLIYGINKMHWCPVSLSLRDKN